jgi:AGZA family xanthine/uracil permease-like MFS transporter
MGLIIDDPVTLVTLGEIKIPFILGIIGLIIIVVLEIKRIKGAILIGIIASCTIGVLLGYVEFPHQLFSAPPSISAVAFKLDIPSALHYSLIPAIFSFMFVDLFDSVGTILACSYEAGLVKKDGSIKNLGKILEADAIATVAGSILGTSTTTTFVESAAGITAGARTGLASVITALMFILTMFFAPVIAAIPAYSTAPALIVVGLYMFKNVKMIDYTNISEAFPAFLTIFLMPLTSISTGISLGFASYILIALFAGAGKVSTVTWIIGILSLVNIIYGAS